MKGSRAADAPAGALSSVVNGTSDEADRPASAAGSDNDERALIDRAKTGDQLALGLLFDRHYAQVYRYTAWKVSRREDAEDLAQEVFVRMLSALGRYQHRGVPFKGWLIQIASNLLNDFYRKRGTTGPTWSLQNEEIDLASDNDPAASAEIQLQLEEVSGAMEHLTELEREVIRLRYAAELSIAETAAVMGKNENNVKQLTFKALGKLRKALQHGDA